MTHISDSYLFFYKTIKIVSICWSYVIRGNCEYVNVTMSLLKQRESLRSVCASLTIQAVKERFITESTSNTSINNVNNLELLI